NYDNDLIADIDVDSSQAIGVAAGGGQGQGGQTYTVKAGDNLSKISKQFYGDADEYMRIFYANQDKLRDPDKIQVGQELTIPKAGWVAFVLEILRAELAGSFHASASAAS